MLKSKKELTLAQKSCIKFSILGAVNAGLGILGFVLSTNTLLTLVSGASLLVSGVWAALAIRAVASKKHNEKAQEKKQHKSAYRKAYQAKKEHKQEIYKKVCVKYPGKDPVSTLKRKLEYNKAVKDDGVAKSAKPFKFWKVASIAAGVISCAIMVGSGAALADNFINASTLASEANTSSQQYVKQQAAINTGIGIGIAATSMVGLGIATVAASKAARKREDDMIEKELKDDEAV